MFVITKLIIKVAIAVITTKKYSLAMDFFDYVFLTPNLTA
jgi:hypothetical protein